MKRCDAPSCPVLVRDSMLMCKPHWFKVSRTTRHEVLDAWTAMGESIQCASHDELQRYLAAVDKAKAEAT